MNEYLDPDPAKKEAFPTEWSGSCQKGSGSDRIMLIDQVKQIRIHCSHLIKVELSSK